MKVEVRWSRGHGLPFVALWLIAGCAGGQPSGGICAGVVCAPGFVCVSGTCVAQGCESSFDCSEGQTCWEGQCVALGPKDSGPQAAPPSGFQPAPADGSRSRPDTGCAASAARACYPGPAGTEGVGLCKAGTQTCTGGVWGGCSGAITPIPEICDEKDNDCNGATDEGCKNLACTGSGLVHTIVNECIEDFGTTGTSDALEVYCCGGIARFCLSKEACPWRGGCVSTSDTCSRSGLTSDKMATADASSLCQSLWWNGYQNYNCSPAKQVYF